MEFLRRRLGLILQVLVSVLVIAWLSRIVDWGEVWQKMRSMDPGWIFLGIICFIPVLLIVSFRWRMLLAVHGIHLRFWRVLELTMIGQFFGTIGLGTTGGDVAKVFYAARAVPTQRAAAAFTIIVDRVIGLMALLLFGGALALSQSKLLYSSKLALTPGLPDPKWVTSLFFLFAIGGIGAGIAATLGPYVMAMPKLRNLAKRLPFLSRGASIFRAYEVTASAVGTNILALIISIPSHVCITIMGYCVIRAMAIPIDDPMPLFAMIAMVNMLVALPISVGGIGVRESLFIAYLGLLGIDKSHATAFSITCFVMNLFWCLAGGPFYFLYRHETHTPPPDVAEVEPIFFRAMNPQACDIVAQLQGAGHVAYLAGGCVRDHLLRVEAKDYDIATDAKPDEVQQLFPRVTDLTGKSFGVVRVMVGDQHFEVAMFRQDGAYIDGRRPESVTPATPELDAQRRDFTINGLFFDPVANRLIDYVGGEADLHAKVLRAIGNPVDRFAEDHLRLLRAIRFATRLNFKIEPKTWESICQAAPSIRTVSAERIRDELNKIFTAHKPELGLDLLDRSGLLKEVLPDVAAMHGVEQPPQYHPEGDVYEHVRLMLTKIEKPDLDLALGVLFHDVGKKPTSKTDENGRIRFNEHESVGARMTEDIMTGLRYDNKSIQTVRELVQHHMQFKDVPKMRPSTLKRMMARSTFALELELHRIDCASSHGDLTHYDYLKHQLETMTPEQIDPPALISGHDLKAMGIPPGKTMGRILEAVKIAQLEEAVQTRYEALKLASKLASRGMETGTLPPPPEPPPPDRQVI